MRPFASPLFGLTALLLGGCVTSGEGGPVSLQMGGDPAWQEAEWRAHGRRPGGPGWGPGWGPRPDPRWGDPRWPDPRWPGGRAYGNFGPRGWLDRDAMTSFPNRFGGRDYWMRDGSMCRTQPDQFGRGRIYCD